MAVKCNIYKAREHSKMKNSIYFLIVLSQKQHQRFYRNQHAYLQRERPCDVDSQCGQGASWERTVRTVYKSHPDKKVEISDYNTGFQQKLLVRCHLCLDQGSKLCKIKEKELIRIGKQEEEYYFSNSQLQIPHHQLQSCHHHQSLQLSGRPLSLHQ